MGKRGRRSTFNEKIRDTIIRLVEEGKTDKQVAEAIGVSKRTLSNWKGNHSDLLQAVREAKLTADELVEMSLYRKAIGWEKMAPDTTAAMFWLRNRQPKKWREKTESDTQVNITNVNSLTDEQLEAKIAEKLAKKEKK